MIQDIDEVDGLERFDNTLQQYSEDVLKKLIVFMKQINKSVQNTDKLLKENLLKLTNLIKSRNNKLKSNRVQIITKLKIVRLQKKLTKTQNAVFEKQNKKSYLDATMNFSKCLLRELRQEVEMVQLQIEEKKKQLYKGLTPETIEKFQKLAADESLVGDQCTVCMEDIEVGRKMMRLDCQGQHVFCQVCIEGWFADHNTCPNCRHVFQNI